MQQWILDATTPVNSWSSALSWLPYAIAGVLLLLLIYLFLENKKIKERKVYYKSRANGWEIELQEKAKIITALTMQKERLEKELADSELDRKSLEDRLKSLELKKVQPKAAAQPAASAIAAPAVAEKATPKPSPQPPKPLANKIKYAHYADMGDGFSNAELLEKPDGETIFEITIAANNTGEYKVTSNADGQRYALSNAQYFLGKTCQYDSFPSNDNAIIRTDKPGTIKLTGSKWTIVNPAKISFT